MNMRTDKTLTLKKSMNMRTDKTLTLRKIYE